MRSPAWPFPVGAWHKARLTVNQVKKENHMEALQKRLEALEQQTEQLKHHTQALEAHTRTVERRLRWWRHMACGLGLVGLLALPLSSVTAQVGQSLEQRVEQLEYKLAHVTSGPDDITISGANLHIVNGLGATNTVNGLGNLIVGYQEHRLPPAINTRTGSHNVIVGRQHNFSSFAGLVVAQFNEISGPWASILGGFSNSASGVNSSVSGGNGNSASGPNSSVSGGVMNRATGIASSVSGGGGNLASDVDSSVSGGRANTASGAFSAVSGGALRTAPADDNWVAGA